MSKGQHDPAYELAERRAKKYRPATCLSCGKNSLVVHDESTCPHCGEMTLAEPEVKIGMPSQLGQPL